MILHQHILPPNPAPVVVGFDLGVGDDFTVFWVRDPHGEISELDIDDLAREQIEGHLPYTRNQTNRYARGRK